ncbi:M23 family metallopeptidase [Adhaeribacter radiodurans]|uniref:M23 family metallopeptidase n=1 Tax=Adhaeribacter radiodurans TaxID=2745197 RepID=A0A7L7L416_9BACT|nr:M23 family metallopeptidase [Adhaeribacter radiodurans]QMU27109.1 M23 family metallopeptidase [Adhaeribacter radiodurans]
MKSLTFIACCFFFYHFHCSAQKLVEVKYEADAKGNYKFTSDNRGYCNYILEVNFSNLQNLRANFRLPFVQDVQPGAKSLFTLTKMDPASPATFRYTYRYVKGCVNPKVNMDYTYLLPVAPGKEVQSQEMDYFLKRYMNEPAPQDWYAISIKMQAGDTVYAARSGTVVEVKDDANLEKTGYTLATADNYIEIYHQDCSFARYQVLKDQNIFVKAGQFIEAGQPIGIVGGEKYVSGPHLRFCVYYTLEKEAFTDYDKADRKSRLAYVPVQFWTKDTGKLKLTSNSKYFSEHPIALVTQGMNRRQIKRWSEKIKVKP